jgi:hypothetical protein
VRGPGPAHSTLMTENSDDSIILHLSQQSAQHSAQHSAQRQSALCMAKYSKRKGEMAELVFALKAISMGFSVSKPFGDSDPYDLVVESHGRLLRIQVKSVFTTNRWGYSVTVARNRLHRPGELYTAQEIDFLAAYVVVHDVWYILPVEEVADVDHIRLYPGGTKRRDGGRYEKYREAWDQLRLGTPALAL